MKSLSNYLFLLIANLSQKRNEKQIVNMFIDGLNSLLTNEYFYWSENTVNENSISISTRKNNFGYINNKRPYTEWENESFAIFQNAVQMIAIILERLLQETLLSEKKLLLEKLVEERTLELKKQNHEYATLNEKYKTQNEELSKAKESAEESEILKNKLVANIGDVIVIIDQEGINRYKSPNIKKLFGWEPEELIGKNAFDNIHPDDIEKARIFINSLLSEPKKTGSTEVRYRHKNGSYVWISFTGSNLFHDPIINGILGNYSNISNKKQAEAELVLAKEKAEEANHLKTQFLNNMSHEIRTPMNGIIGFSELLDKPDISVEKRKYYSKIVQNSSHQLLNIIDDILEISTLETKQEKLNETVFCLNDLLMEIFSIFNLKSKEKNIPLYLKKALQGEQSYIISDKSKLNKIISNLLENALKFTSEGFVEFGYQLDKSNLILYVKDTGIGISPKNHQIVFDRFSQEDKEISIKHGGLGLGLSICKANSLLLGGDITLESEKGKGSTFYVSIPYQPVQQANNNTSKNIVNEQQTNDKYTILIAEDEEVNYLYIEVLFENEIEGNYNLIHAKNGKEAIEICTLNNHIDLVLMDIKMPIMNGHEATIKIKEKLPNLPIIAQTAYSTETDKQMALKHGCDDFISKPINKENLFGLINKYLNVR